MRSFIGPPSRRNAPWIDWAMLVSPSFPTSRQFSEVVHRALNASLFSKHSCQRVPPMMRLSLSILDTRPPRHSRSNKGALQGDHHALTHPISPFTAVTMHRVWLQCHSDIAILAQHSYLHHVQIPIYFWGPSPHNTVTRHNDALIRLSTSKSL
jgi:hypothetical protein